MIECKFYFLDFNLYIRDGRKRGEDIKKMKSVLWLSAAHAFFSCMLAKSTLVLSCDIKEKN